jgi:hypothetical protein
VIGAFVGAAFLSLHVIFYLFFILYLRLFKQNYHHLLYNYSISEVFQFVSRWAANPTWWALPLPVAVGAALRVALPLEASLVMYKE